MDSLAGQSDFVFSYAAAPNERSYRMGGLPPSDYPGTGIPSPVYAIGSAGDAGEGSLLLQHLGVARPETQTAPDAGVMVNHDSGFTPLPGVLPGEKHLNYARTATLTTLLTVAIIYLAFKAFRSPGEAARLVGRAAGRQAGV